MSKLKQKRIEQQKQIKEGKEHDIYHRLDFRFFRETRGLISRTATGEKALICLCKYLLSYVIMQVKCTKLAKLKIIIQQANLVTNKCTLWLCKERITPTILGKEPTLRGLSVKAFKNYEALNLNLVSS